MIAVQHELFEMTTEQKFDDWMEKPGARQVARDIYRMAANYARAWKRTGVKVSMKLLWEIERQRIKEVRTRAQRMGRKIEQYEGYTLNNIFTAPMVRHIYRHRPAWRGLFETRERSTKPGPRLARILPLRGARA